MSMQGVGKATIARITAERFGCKDEALLKLIEKLAASDIVIGKPAFFGADLPEHTYAISKACYTLEGTMDGKPFMLTLSGPAVEEFA